MYEIEFLEFSLWTIVVLLGFYLAFIFLRQYKSRESLQRPFFLGIAIFAVTYSTARLIENIRRYFIGSYNDIFNAWKAGTQITGINFLLRVWGYYAIAWFGIAVMFYNIEHHIFKKNRYLLTMVSAAEGVVSIINYFWLTLTGFWITTVLFFVVMFMPLMFLNLARKTPAGPIRNACILVAIGIVLFAVGVMIDLPEFAYFNYIMGQESPEAIIRIIAPIMIIMGISTLGYGFKTFFPKE